MLLAAGGKMYLSHYRKARSSPFDGVASARGVKPSALRFELQPALVGIMEISTLHNDVGLAALVSVSLLEVLTSVDQRRRCPLEHEACPAFWLSSFHHFYVPYPVFEELRFPEDQVARRTQGLRRFSSNPSGTHVDVGCQDHRESDSHRDDDLAHHSPDQLQPSAGWFSNGFTRLPTR